MKQKNTIASNLLLITVIAFGLIAFVPNNTTISVHTLNNTINKQIKMTSVTTYLLFNGNCLQAMQFYKSCIGGELTYTKVDESPMKNFFPESMHNKIVNARLTGDGIDISASDWLRPGVTPVQGNTVCLYIRAGSAEQLTAMFNKLAEGATVTDSLQQQPFGLYGALTDKFGNRWMLIYQ